MAMTVVFDFDGVIHSYTSGWQGEDAIPDPPVPGIREALKEIHDAGYEVVVVSTRCATIKGHRAIEAWLYDNGLREYIDKVCKEKPPAVAYIDDRAICFDGHPEALLKKIQNFQPWYKMPTLTPPNEPLTLDELRQMGGEPVWIQNIEEPNKSQWRLCHWDRGKYLVLQGISVKGYLLEEYGESWLAYAYPPAHIDREAWEPCAKCVGCGNCYYFLYDDDEYPCNKCLKESTDKNQYPKFEPIGFCKHCGRPLTEDAWASWRRGWW